MLRPLSFSEASKTQLTDSSHCIFLCGLALFFPNFTREDHVGTWTGPVQVSIDYILSETSACSKGQKTRRAVVIEVPANSG